MGFTVNENDSGIMFYEINNGSNCLTIYNNDF